MIRAGLRSLEERELAQAVREFEQIFAGGRAGEPNDRTPPVSRPTTRRDKRADDYSTDARDDVFKALRRELEHTPLWLLRVTG